MPTALPEKQPFDFLYKHTEAGKVLKPEIEYILSRIQRHYREEKQEKSDGGTRIIHKPSETLKKIQRDILRDIQKINETNNIISKNIFGIGGNTVKQKVLLHKDHRHIFKIDIKNFFNSINYSKVKQCFILFGCGDRESDILTKLTTYKYCIPQGVPTSAILASICLINFDRRMDRLCKKLNMTYTRYIDDMVISSKEKIKDETERVIKKMVLQQGLRTNKKTERIDTKNNHCKITGVILQDKKLITVYHHGQEKHSLITKHTPIKKIAAFLVSLNG